MFEENYAVCFVDARVLHIVDDMMSSKFLAANYNDPYPRYTCVAKIIIINDRVVPLLVSLPMHAPVVTILEITHLVEPGLYISAE